MTGLERLRLHRNMLDGEIPASLGDLDSLRFLWLHGNLLSGPVPASLGELTDLERFWLSENDLSGQLPVQLGALSSHSLIAWRLSRNQLTGCVPPGLADVEDNDLEQARVGASAPRKRDWIIDRARPTANFRSHLQSNPSAWELG